MPSYIPIYQKRDGSVVPVITIDTEPSLLADAAGHLVDSNGIAKAIQDAVAGVGGDGFPVVDIINTSSDYKVPAGGTWAYVAVYQPALFSTRAPKAGRVAGGTVIAANNTAMFGLAIRVA